MNISQVQSSRKIIFWVKKKQQQQYFLASFGSPSFLTHLYLTWSNIELLKNVDEKSLHFIPGVDGVWAIQNDHNVHIGLTSWKTFKDES